MTFHAGNVLNFLFAFLIYNITRVVKWAQNPIVLFAKLRKPQFHKLRKLRKLRIAICVFCEIASFYFAIFYLNESAGIRTK